MRTLQHVLIASILLMLTGSTARADLVLSGGGAWPSGGGGPRPVGALGWRGGCGRRGADRCWTWLKKLWGSHGMQPAGPHGR